MPVCCTQLFVASESLDGRVPRGARAGQVLVCPGPADVLPEVERAVGVAVQLAVLVMELSSRRVTAAAVMVYVRFTAVAKLGDVGADLASFTEVGSVPSAVYVIRTFGLPMCTRCHS